MSIYPGRVLVRLMTYNIHKGYAPFKRGFRLAEQREALHAQQSDLIFLQEVCGHEALPEADAPGASVSAVSPGSPDCMQHCEYMADKLWSSHAWARNAVTGNRAHGNAVLSRYPIVRWHNHLLEMEGDEPRGLLHCEIQLPGQDQPLHAVCVHLGLRDSHRRQQLDRLRSLVDEDVPASAPLVVAGDFNDWRLRASGVLRGSGLEEVFERADGAAARSFPSWLPTLRLDRIYVRHVRHARTLRLTPHPWSRLSDHLPLAAEIEI